jgi:hypothetical protein
MTNEKETVNKVDMPQSGKNGEADQLTVEQWLAIRKEAALRIDPDTAEVDWTYAQTLDPYGLDPELPEEFHQVGREYFARAPGSDIWVWFGDLPKATEDALWEKHKRRLAFPAGLPGVEDLHERGKMGVAPRSRSSERRHINTGSTFQLTREQLYELVWTEPIRRLSKRIGISDVAIAKHCRKLGIPIPERGYWNKLQAGHKVTKPELPPRDLGTVNLVKMSGTLDPELRARITGEPGAEGETTESIDVLTARFRARLGKVSVPREFLNAHPRIAKLLEKDEKLRQELATQPNAWNQPRFDSSFERRRLRLLNGLFLGFAKVGGSPWLRGDNARELAMHIGNANVSFELDAVGIKTQTRRNTQRQREAHARLFLAVRHHGQLGGITTRWEDHDGCLLEDQITEAIVGMAVAGAHLHRRWVEEQAASQKKQQQEKERRAREQKAEAEGRERERAAATETAKRDALLTDAVAWRNAETVRAFVAAAGSAMTGGAVTHGFESWARWALAEATRLDPISSGRFTRVSELPQDKCTQVVAPRS